MSKQYFRPQEVMRYLHISDFTLYRWAKEERIKSIRTKGGHRRYPIEEVLRLGGDLPEDLSKDLLEEKERFCYGRVSSYGQKEDLDRQVQLLGSKYPTHTIVTDIGSGLNFKRKGFQRILDKAIKGKVQEIVVTHRDRLCRFGFELLEKILGQHGGAIVVLNHKDTSPKKELVDDLISIITSFAGRVHGLRSGKIRKAIREGASNQESQISSVSE